MKALKFLIAPRAEDLSSIPPGAHVLGLKLSESENPVDNWARERCDLGNLAPNMDAANPYDSLCMETRKDGPIRTAFIEAYLDTDGPEVWIIMDRFDVDNALTICMLEQRARSFSFMLAQPEAVQRRHEMMLTHLHLVSIATEYAAGAKHEWPGVQGGYTRAEPWKKHGGPDELQALAGIHQLTEWASDFVHGTRLSIDEALFAISHWLWIGMPTSDKLFDEPLVTLRTARTESNAELMLRCAQQWAEYTRQGMIRHNEALFASIHLSDSKRLAVCNLTDKDAHADINLIGRAGLNLAPVSVVSYREPHSGAHCLRITAFNARYFMRHAFAQGVARNCHTGQIRWGYNGPHPCVTCIGVSPFENAAFGHKSLLSFVEGARMC